MTTGVNCKECRHETELSVIEGFFKCVNAVCKNYNQHVIYSLDHYKHLQGSLDFQMITGNERYKSRRWYR